VRFSLFCKTFRGDIDRFAFLLDSLERTNKSSIPLLVSLPKEDKAEFDNRVGTHRFQCVFDEDVVGRVERQGWRHQQLVKLCAHRLDFADAWLLLDSDYYFIKDFQLEDLVDGDSVAFPVSRSRHVMDDDREVLFSYVRGRDTLVPVTKEECLAWRDERELPRSLTLDRVRDFFFKPDIDRTPARIPQFFHRSGGELSFMPGPIWTADCLRSMVVELLEPRGWGFKDLLRHAPWEATWVGEWELYRGLPHRHIIETMIPQFREDETILEARKQGLTEAVMSRRYLGVSLAARHQSLLSLDPR
jgi:hypothetical protein